MPEAAHGEELGYTLEHGDDDRLERAHDGTASIIDRSPSAWR
jgi:hypothetical protein